MTVRGVRFPVLILAVLMSCGGGGSTGDGGLGAGGGTGGSAGGTGGGTGGGTCDGGSVQYALSGGLRDDGSFTDCAGSLSGHTNNKVRAFFGRADSTLTHYDSRGVDLLFPAVPGTYICDGGSEVMMAFQQSHTRLDGTSSVTGRWDSNAAGVVSCVLTLTTIDATPGGAVRGTFSAVLAPIYGSPQKPDAGVTLSNGAFDTLYY